MSTPDYAGLVFAAACGALLLPSTVQRIRRRRDQRIAATRRHEWADARLEAELRRVIDQRDRYCRLYHEAAQRNAILLGLNDMPAGDVPTPLFDRACLAWLDKATDWNDAS